MKTKQEEIQILRQIENLIAEAGEDSYIGMAFAGCVHMAFDNINNDWGNSYPEKLAHREKQIASLTEELERSDKWCEDQKRALKRKQEEIEELRQQVKTEKAKQIPINLYRDLWCAVNNQIDTANKEIDNLVEILAMCADTPTDIAATEGLKRMKTLTERRSAAKGLLAALEKYEPEDI